MTDTWDTAQRRQDALGVRLYRAWQALGLKVSNMPKWPSEALVEEYEAEATRLAEVDTS